MTQHVVIAGGGVGALEGLLALQSLAGDRVHISVVTPTRRLTYRALSVAEPFGGEPAPRYEWEHIARDRDVRWVPDKLQEVRTARPRLQASCSPAPNRCTSNAAPARPPPRRRQASSSGGRRTRSPGATSVAICTRLGAPLSG